MPCLTFLNKINTRRLRANVSSNQIHGINILIIDILKYTIVKNSILLYLLASFIIIMFFFNLKTK